ncbi:probable bifunctional dTTP/UTP pyrophosphatase/methyltransferase protein isoform X2 [Asterias amurensis]|uniref:probable bifunctional dTTP/UTP pyrophosphatase/methyltransferase protein isoform X2 n=1 Tax=Asterias amurensis TaxID=7602 RepID=UPI003AB81BAC
MLQPIISELSSMRIILASGSPRRKDVLSKIGLKFEVVPSTFEENLDKSLFNSAKDYVKETALKKAEEVAQRLQGANQPNLIIGADTVVVLGDTILEKPRDDEHAYEMLSQLNGSSHYVHTGVALLTPKRGDKTFDKVQFHETTEVKFADLSPEIIRAYVATGESLDKAGGYGIQEIGGSLVQSVSGDYFNVVGFPLHSFCKQLLLLLGKS